MQDPNEDTEWNDILRKHGILPAKPKPPPVEDEVDLTETVVNYDEMTLKELDEMEDDLMDDEEEAVMNKYRQQRLAEMQAKLEKAKFGEVREISAVDYVEQVNKAGEGIWVVLHLYKQGIPLCSLINQHLTTLAKKFPEVKFLKSISTTCIPNFPDRNLPTIFVYKDGNMITQWLGAGHFGGMQLTCDQLEWKFHEKDILKSTLEKDPKREIRDVMMSSIRSSFKPGNNDDSSDDDDY